jgi:hypothetical protein
MSVTLLTVFDEHFKNVIFDEELAKEMYIYQIGYVNANKEHLEFFGGNLLGVQTIRFKDSDVMRLFVDILDVDFMILSKDLLKVSDINQNYKITSDVFNLTIFYMIHRFFISKELGKEDAERGAYDCALMFFYRTISALMCSYFQYATDPKVAQKAYANLSKMYLIKKLGSWHKYMDYRATKLTSKDSTHYKNLVTFNKDLKVTYAISDSQGSVRDMVKNYCYEFFLVSDNKEGIGITSSTFKDMDGEDTIKDKLSLNETSVIYMKNLLGDRNSFIKRELVEVIVSINSNTSFRMLNTVLSWLSDNSNNLKLSKEIDEYVRDVIVHSYHLIDTEIKPHNHRDYAVIMSGLKGLYLASRNKNTDIINIRKTGDKFVRLANEGQKLSDSLVFSTRTSVILYLSLRALIGTQK